MQTGGGDLKLIVRGDEPSIAGHSGSPVADSVVAIVVVEVVDPLNVVEVVVDASVATVVSADNVVSATAGCVVVGSGVEAGNAADVSDPDAVGTVESAVAASTVVVALGSFTATVTLSFRWLYAPTPTAPAITAKAKHVTNAVRLMGFGEATA